MQALEERPGLPLIEPRIDLLDDEEEAIGGGPFEGGHVEHGVVRLGQTVECPHPEEGREGRPEHGGLEGHRNELGPAVERAIPDVHRVPDDRRHVREGTR
jgi:hypothetical protein